MLTTCLLPPPSSPFCTIGQVACQAGESSSLGLLIPVPPAPLFITPLSSSFIGQVAYKAGESSSLGLLIPMEAAENKSEVAQYQASAVPLVQSSLCA